MFLEAMEGYIVIFHVLSPATVTRKTGVQTGTAQQWSGSGP